MKKTVLILFLLLAFTLTVFSSCLQNPWKDRVIERALIERISPKIIHIQTVDEAGQIQHYNINICDDVRWHGEKIALSDLHVGDYIRVTYDGAVVELYPALIEGTTKIELLGETISTPTTTFTAKIEQTDGEQLTVLGTTEGYQNVRYSLTPSNTTHVVREHRIIDFSTLKTGDSIRITYRGDLTDQPEIIRIEIITSDRYGMTE